MPKEETKRENIVLTPEQYDGLMSRITRLETGKGIMKPKRVKDHEALVRYYNGKPVIKYSNHQEIIQERTGKRIGFFDILLMGETKPVNVEYLKFLNEPNAVKVKIISQEAKEEIANEGTITTQNPDPAKISGSKDWQATDVELEVTSYKYVAKVEVIEEGEHKGETFEIDAAALNA